MKNIQQLHRDAMTLLNDAEKVLDERDKYSYLDLATQAFLLEKEAAIELTDHRDSEPTRGVLFRSAATLAYNIGDFQESKVLIENALAGYPFVEVKKELMWMRRKATTAIKKHYDFDDIFTLNYGIKTGNKPAGSKKRYSVVIIQEIKDYIDENLYETITVPALCRLFTIDREYLQSGFRTLVQSTVHGYIIRQRIVLAAKRLLESDDSIKEISRKSGFEKQRSFNRIFSVIFKRTPAAYREQKQNQEKMEPLQVIDV